MSVVDWSPFAEFDTARPGLVAAVVSGGGVADWRSFGAVSPADEDALDLETPLYVASLAKQFTAACVGLLVLDGRLTTSDLLGRWAPEFPNLDSIRIEHLLSHTSGLPASNDLDDAAGFTVDRSTTTDERLQVLRAVELEHEPGTVHRYSNHGYVLLGEIVARATGAPLGAFAADQIFAPLGMTSTGYLDVTQLRPAPGWANGTRRVDIRFTCTGDGGLVSTVADLARWDAWLPSSPLADLMLRSRPVTPDGTCAHNAWGISIRTHHGERIESHGGAVDGYLAKHVRFPRLETSFIALANTDERGVADFDDRVRRLADATLSPHFDFDQPSWTETVGTGPRQP